MNSIENFVFDVPTEELNTVSEIINHVKYQEQNKKYKLELTEEELNFIYDRCSNKAARLEDVNLEDTPCYRLAHQIMHKICKEAMYPIYKEIVKMSKNKEA